MLNVYFEAKVGDKIQRRITTGDDRFDRVYARTYVAEVLYTVPDLDRVVVHVTSYDVHPSGARAGDTDRDLGDHAVDGISDIFGLDVFWQVLLKQIGGEDAAMLRFFHRNGRNAS